MGNWYSEGVSVPPPPCMHNKCLYNCLSQNCFCNMIGKCGFGFGDRNRSKIMFFAFIFSMIGLAFLGACLATVSTDRVSVQNVPFFYGTFKPDTGKDFDYYMGVRMIYLKCPNGASNCESTHKWENVDCDSNELEIFDKNTCEDCQKASSDATSAIVISFISQIPQIFTDLSRSKSHNDLNCMKFIGIFTGIIGFISNLIALAGFTNNCYNQIDSSYGDDNYTVDVDKSMGAGFFLLLFSTLLKLIDIIAHYIVPVPEKGYFGSDNDTSKTTTQNPLST